MRGPCDELLALSNAYMALLRIPPCGFRLKHQVAYCDLRDRIADLTQTDPKDVQEAHERVAYSTALRK